MFLIVLKREKYFFNRKKLCRYGEGSVQEFAERLFKNTGWWVVHGKINKRFLLNHRSKIILKKSLNQLKQICNVTGSVLIFFFIHKIRAAF